MTKTNIRKRIANDKRLLKERLRELVVLAENLTKTGDITSVDSYSHIQQIESLIVQIKGIRTSIYRSEKEII